MALLCRFWRFREVLGIKSLGHPDISIPCIIVPIFPDLFWLSIQSLLEVSHCDSKILDLIFKFFLISLYIIWVFPGSSDSKKICMQCRRPGFNPWVRKILWSRKQQPTLVLLPGESPRTEEPGRLQSRGSWRVGLKQLNDWSDLAHTHGESHQMIF